MVIQATPVITWATPAGIAYGTALTATQLNATTPVAGTFVYSSPLGTVLTAGSHLLTATFTPTDAVNYTAATATVTLDVTQATPVITWATPAGIAYGTALSATQFNATTPVAGTIVYSSPLGTVLNAGSHTLTATFTPTDAVNYTTATATVTLVVAQATPVITWATPAEIAYGTALTATQLDATTPVAGTFVYSSPLGTVLNAGSHLLTATFTPTDAVNYTTATATVTLVVSQATPVITWATPAGIAYGTALSATQLNATTPVAGTFAYSSPLGTVLNAGSHPLTATFTPTDGVNYTTATATVTLDVTQATPVITWATPAGIAYGTALTATQLNATTPVAGTFAYSSPLGTVLNAGSHLLTATFMPTDAVNYTTATATVTLVVTQATPVITWPAPAAITYGTALSATQLNATTPVAGTFVYSSPLGTVLNAGSHTLTATFTPTDAVNYTTATATVTLDVTQATPVITWAMPAGIAYGTPLSATQLNATTPVAGSFVYSSPLGTVLNAGSRTLTATFTPTDAVNYTTATATVTLVVTQATPVITWATPAGISYGTALSATQLNATTPVAGTFAYSSPLGTVLNAGSHTLTATFTPTDAVNYTTATATVTLDVTQATPVIAWATPAGIAYGTALSATQLSATTPVAGTFVYAPVLGAVLNAGTGQTLSVTFTPTDAVNYTTATATVLIDVAKATPTITWVTPAAITYGTALSATQLNATTPVAGTFAYSSPLGTVLNAGSHTLTATFTPTDAVNYTTATATVTLNVTQATPVITWATPAAITYGTALTATQLNATTPVAGTFAYSSPLGTVLNAGSHTLTATFTPTDAVNYAAATATVTLVVTQATPVITWATPAAITSARCSVRRSSMRPRRSPGRLPTRRRSGRC